MLEENESNEVAIESYENELTAKDTLMAELREKVESLQTKLDLIKEEREELLESRKRFERATLICIA